MAETNPPNGSHLAIEFVKNATAAVDAARDLAQCMQKTTPLQRTFFRICSAETNAATEANARAQASHKKLIITSPDNR